MTDHAIITGGNKGLGLAQSLAFLRSGSKVTVLARSQGEFASLQDTFGDAVNLVECNLPDADHAAVVNQIAEAFGAPTVLVNNAGRHLKKTVWEIGDDEWDAVVELNLTTLFSLSRAFINLRKEDGGAIVNISSMAGLMGLPGAAAYVASKTAVIGLTRSIAVDAAPFGIRCNAVCPGFIETDMTREVLAKDPARRAKIEARMPNGQWGRPEDVAEACLFLASDRASYISGVALPVDGAFSVGF